MKRLILSTIIALLSATCLMAQNQASVLRAIENSQLIELSNGFRIQIVKTGEYREISARLTADVSNVPETNTPGGKQIISNLIGGNLVANEVITKSMIGHDQALDSLLNFMQGVMYSNDRRYINYAEYRSSRERYLRQHGNTMGDEASLMIGLPSATAENLNQTSEADFYSLRSQCFSPERCLITIVSNIDEAEVRKLAEKHFGNIQRQTQPKTKAAPKAIAPKDLIYLIADTSGSKFEAVYKHYYPCDKTPKNYILNSLCYYMTFGKYLTESTALSCFKYDVNTLHTEKNNSAFQTFVKDIYDPRDPNFKNDAALNEAKKKAETDFKAMFKMPDNVAEMASNIVLYNFPKNFYTSYVPTMKAITTAETQQFMNTINENGASVLLIRGNEQDLHCAILDQAQHRDVTITHPGHNAHVVQFYKGFGAQQLINNYLKITGLNNAPKNMEARFSSTYTYPDGDVVRGAGRILRKAPNMYMIENYILHGDSLPLFHYHEKYDGVSGSDSTKLYGYAPANPMRMQELKQKATYPQEAHYEELGMKARLICSYKDFKDGYIKVAVTEAGGRNFHDYYSLSTGLRDRTDIVNQQGLTLKTILYEYSQYDKYTLPSKITELSIDMKVQVEFSSYDLKTPRKKTEFQTIIETKGKKK